jgi:hypothetical protein
MYYFLSKRILALSIDLHIRVIKYQEASAFSN